MTLANGRLWHLANDFMLVVPTVRYGSSPCENVREVAERHLADVRAKIADLQAMEDVLADAVRRCAAGEVPGCPIIDALSAA